MGSPVIEFRASPHNFTGWAKENARFRVLRAVYNWDYQRWSCRRRAWSAGANEPEETRAAYFAYRESRDRLVDWILAH